jgi:glycosyltransferase involved in cell wall biosynthesis
MLYSTRIRHEVENEIRTFRPQVIHLHNAYPAFGPAVALMADELGLPLILTVHNHRLRCPNGLMFTGGAICRRCEAGAYHNAVLHPCFPQKTQAVAYASTLWVHRFVFNIEKRISMFVTPSRYLEAKLGQWGIPGERVRLVRNFTPRIPERPSAPGMYGAYVGRLSHEKGVHILLRALKYAGDPPFKIVGTGPESSNLRSLASTLELRRTEFVGLVPQATVAEVLRGARFAVVPSLWNENAPLAALEAMAQGRPIVASSLGGLPELAEDGRGCVVPAGDVAALASGIDSYMRSDSECATAGAAAHAFARQELSPTRHLELLEDAYDELTRR